MKQRIISLKTISNCRDLGGLINQEGRRIRRRHLIRSAKLSRASRQDLEKLRDLYKVNLVIDLRTDREVRQKPDVRVEGIDYLHIPVFTEAMLGMSHEDDGNIIKNIDKIPDFRDLYRLIVNEESCRTQMKKVLLTIMNHRGGGVLWHCSEGKDRCGLVSAFLLHLLGCDRETIIEDYLMTNLVASKRAGKYYLLVLLASRSRRKARKIQGVFLAEEEYLQAALSAIEDNYESMDRYFYQVLGITEAEVRRFRKYCLARPAASQGTGQSGINQGDHACKDWTNGL